ncbi:MAG: PAS domain-containing methyl-accepting chemotaxis protein [Granulosicoccus sp.]
MLNRFKNNLSNETNQLCEAQLVEMTNVMAALNLSQAVIEFELDGTVISANENFLTTMGYELSELIGKNHRIFMRNADATSQDYQQLWETIRSGKSTSTRCRSVTKRGDVIWLQANYNPILNTQGLPYKVMKIATEVTDQQLEKAAYESQITAIQRAQAVIEFDLDGTILWANENFTRAVGYELPEIVGKHHRIFVNPQEHQTAEYIAFWKALNRGEFVADQFKRIGKDGSELWLQATYNPILNPSGDPVKVIKYAIDITEQKAHQQNLSKMLTEATQVMGAIARGDLTIDMQGEYDNSLKPLSTSINQTISQLDVTIGRLIDSTSSLQDGSQALMVLNEDAYNAANNSAQQTDRASSTALQVATTVDEVATALTEMVTAIREIAENSADAVSIAEKAVELSGDAKLNVGQLADSSNDIGAVIKVINSIADQTNLLALNATIEAARAGDAGKGFAVVANEVKELAKETARATEEVSEKISKIQSDSQSATRIINEISDTIVAISSTQSSIASTVEEQRAVSADISRSINETATGTTQIATDVGNIADVAKESLSHAKQSQITACELSNLSDSLTELASHFTLMNTSDINRKAA